MFCIINGSDEGVYAWVVANYALGTVGGDPKQTTGIIELGGAAAQMLRKLSKQLNSEDWIWNNLNTLLGNRIYIRINDGGTSVLLYAENKFLVMVIRDLLNLCEITKGKDNKVVIASNIMQMTVNSSFR
ncbi:protein EXPORTIN 1A-like isoform X3 [Coffea eugenioides]|uniref:protein EXPORTIN 1A-like isoform X3 n=1 Tax=Coffea eugenioides TaxID=49369 RepID=UPI000F614AE3|nr:protein EXPORTIN 1A-like isoform X3 [Coffea eugenioides]